MKPLKTMIAMALAAFTLTTIAAGPDWPPPPWKRINTAKQAEECCDAGGKVAFSCKDCKVLNETGDKKKAAALFDKNATHECSGCKGKVTVRQVGAGKGPTEIKFTHDCSKCGKESAFTCATHVKK